MRPKGTAEELERRRLRAVELVDKNGLTQREAAERVGASLREVQRWMAVFRQSGKEGLKAKPNMGRRPKLSKQEKVELSELLLQGPAAFGYTDGLWSCPRIARVIKKHFGKTYHSHHLPKLLRSLGWSLQRPSRRAAERDDVAINRWQRRIWAGLKKSPESRGKAGIY